MQGFSEKLGDTWVLIKGLRSIGDIAMMADHGCAHQGLQGIVLEKLTPVGILEVGAPCLGSIVGVPLCMELPISELGYSFIQ